MLKSAIVFLVWFLVSSPPPGAEGFRLPMRRQADLRRPSSSSSSTRPKNNNNDSGQSANLQWRRPLDKNRVSRDTESLDRPDHSPLTMMMACSSRQHAAVTVFAKMLSKRALSSSSPPATAATAASTVLRGGAAAAAMAGGAPKLVTWIGPALACATSYALYNLFIKKASSSIDPILGGVLLQFVAALIGSGLLLLQTATKSGGSALQITKVGLLWSAAAGCAVGAAEILSFMISGMGVEATQSIPIVVGGSILVGTILGAVWLRERLTLRGWFGVLMIAAGIALVGIDPGSSMGH